jgi:hypothetical protein
VQLGPASPPPPPRIRYRIELFDGERRWCSGISVRGYRPTAANSRSGSHLQRSQVSAAHQVWESWALKVSAWQLRRIRDEQVFDRTEVRLPDPATHIESKGRKQ